LLRNRHAAARKVRPDFLSVRQASIPRKLLGHEGERRHVVSQLVRMMLVYQRNTCASVACDGADGCVKLSGDQLD
jgi:hypothetical protein